MTGILGNVSNKSWLVVTQSCLGGLIFGYATGIIVGALGPIADKFDASTPLMGVIVCSILLGALIGAFAGGFAADKFGRKPLLLFTSISCVGGAIGSGLGNDLITICIFRFFHGLGVGSSSSVCPLMVSEMVPANRKGIFGSFFQISITVGILIANIISYVIEGDYRLMFCLGAIPGGLLFFVWLIIGESPVYLEKKNRRLNISQGNTQDIVVNQSENSFATNFKILFSKRSRKPMLVGVLLAILAQLTGINAFMYFSTTIFKDAGISNPNAAAIALQVWNVLTTLIAIFLVDKLGRRFLLFTGSIVMTVCDLLIALFFVVLSGSAKGWSSIVFLFIFVGAFEASIGTLFWFVINEILPEDSKSLGAPIINACQWTFNLILSFFFLVVVKYLGQSTMFWIFGGIGVFCTVFLYFNLPANLGSNNTTTEEINTNTTQEPIEEQPVQLEKETIEDLEKAKQEEEYYSSQPPANIQA